MEWQFIHQILVIIQHTISVIGTTTTPDYYAVGLLAIIVLIRTVLSFSINRELMSIGKE